ncbi:GNAT family N-acetyltransferase [uncultured Neglectibacter sp.]|uniref:GNAT family N-acetyltransferase n=1 Tax=uncultured Neglectibacter sp. TaxID=1924108 RepID=UPI0034E03336
MKTNLLFSSFPFIAGEKVTLTRMTELDLRSLWEIMGDDENYRFAPTAALRTYSECAPKLRQAEALFRERKAVVLGIYSNDGNHQLVGIFEIFDVAPEVETASIRFTINRRYWGKGYASGALREVTEYLMEKVELHRIQAYVMPINYRGILVLERCGFQKEGTIREGILWPDKGIVDLSLYSLLPTDLRPKKAGQPFYL